MENIMEFIKTETFLLILVSIMALLLIGFVVMVTRFSKLNKKYKNFMQKLGNGKNLEEDLETYMYKVNKVEQQNAQIENEIKNMDKNITKCIQKVGIVRYNAFENTGSNLSFALALLDKNNSGIVLNGIFSREMSNIYAKPVENGKSTYIFSEEETQALQKAME